MPKKLFCEISPLTYKIAVTKNKCKRYLKWVIDGKNYAAVKSKTRLPVQVYEHQSIIRRTLGNVDHRLQNNKAINLRIAGPKVDGIIIKPGEVFSFWKLVGACTSKKGYLPGLMIKGGQVSEGIGGGMCQFTNLIHWMVLHSPLTIIEHHHHNALDLFPDFKRRLPFGTGTSIMHNYLDYQFVNHTKQSFQIEVGVDDTYLWGRLLCQEPLDKSYHILEEDHYFTREGDEVYRNNQVYRIIKDQVTGKQEDKQLVIKNHSRVVYDYKYINDIRETS